MANINTAAQVQVVHGHMHQVAACQVAARPQPFGERLGGRAADGGERHLDPDGLALDGEVVDQPQVDDIDAELGINPDELTNPWHAAISIPVKGAASVTPAQAGVQDTARVPGFPPTRE